MERIILERDQKLCVFNSQCPIRHAIGNIPIWGRYSEDTVGECNT
ncbi:hypothetical protein [Scytonema hofmannii]|nr:hypothetical protein [Scytonema hofmannii]